MRRIQFFEFEDQKWLPEFIRHYITDILHFVMNTVNIYKPVLDQIEKGLKMSDEKVIIDLCSGSSGAILKINEQLKNRYEGHYDIILTDLYPNTVTLDYVTSKATNIAYEESPVDALEMPMKLKERKSFRTMFASFHHFQPDEAKKILEDAVKSHTPIGIFEITERKFSTVFKVITLDLFFTFIFSLFIRPFRLSRIILTYIIPIIPLCYVWDGVVSALRSYKPEELKQMTEEIHAPNYSWDMGRKSLNRIAHVVYVLGYPKK